MAEHPISRAFEAREALAAEERRLRERLRVAELNATRDPAAVDELVTAAALCKAWPEVAAKRLAIIDRAVEAWQKLTALEKIAQRRAFDDALARSMSEEQRRLHEALAQL